MPWHTWTRSAIDALVNRFEALAKTQPNQTDIQLDGTRSNELVRVLSQMISEINLMHCTKWTRSVIDALVKKPLSDRFDALTKPTARSI